MGEIAFVDSENRGEQPCKSFKVYENERSPFHGGPIGHECPGCDGTRWFCGNCHIDHHSKGWESCQQKKQ